MTTPRAPEQTDLTDLAAQALAARRAAQAAVQAARLALPVPLRDGLDAYLGAPPEHVFSAAALSAGGEWIEVPAVFERFAGVRAQTWRATVRQLRAHSRHDARFDEDTVFEALRTIDAINDNAMARIGLVADDWSKDRVDREEERLFLGVDCVATRRAAPQATGDTRFGEEIVPPADAGAPAPPAPQMGQGLPPAPPGSAPDAAPDDASGWEIEDDP